MLSTFLLVYVCFATTSSFDCPTADPCQTLDGIPKIPKVLNRGVDTAVVSGEEICDTDLTEGWYRFIDDDGNKFTIPVRNPVGGVDQCVDVGRCGTTAPISLTDDPPTVAGETKKLKGCINFIDCCFFSQDVCARLCGEETIYYLTVPIACSIAYCSSAPSCATNQVVRDGQCDDAYPVLQQKPLLTPASREVATNHDEVVFQCQIFGPDENVHYNVTWEKDGVKVTTSVIEDATLAEVSLRDIFGIEADASLLSVQIGFNLVCIVTARFIDQTVFSPELRSSAFFAGLSVDPLTLVINENDPVDKYNITVKPTVPVVCKGSATCHLDIAIGNRQFTAQDEVLSSLCGLRFDNNNWNTPQSFEIASVRDQVEDGQQDQIIQVKKSFVLEKDKIPLEWFSLTDKSIRVTSRNVRSAYCKGTGDPHFTTFDGDYYHYYGVGDFWLVRNPTLTRTMGVLEIQSRIWTCRQSYTSVSCHCGVAVREGNDIVSIDQCFWQQRDPETRIRNIPPRVRKHSAGPLQTGFGVYKNPSGTQFKIQLPSGAAVKVDANYWGMSVYVRVAEDDDEETEGFCGNNNGNRNDDMIGRDGVTYAKDPRSIAKNAFVDTWRVPEDENLFSSNVVQTIANTGTTGATNNPTTGRFCLCTKPDGTLTTSESFTCPNFLQSLLIQPKAFAGNQWTEVGQDLRSKRAVAGPDDVPTDEDDVDDDYDFVFDPTASPPVFQFPTPSNITESAAVDECNRVLTASPVAKACIEDGIIDAISNNTIESCVEDIKLSDDLSTASAYLDSVLQQCEESLADDVDYWKPNRTITNDTSVDASQLFLVQPSLPSIIASSVCPRDCSNRGQCVNSTCICQANFTGPDCSIDSNAAPSLITFTNNGLCDRRLKPCRTAFAVGEGFLNNENLSCTVERQETGEEFQVLSQFQSIYEVTCALPPSRVQPEESVEVETEPVDHLSVRVTVDGRVFSDALAYSSFDSVCYDCPEAGSCVRKNNTCLIRGHCFADREANPLDWCQQCLPQVNETGFSERIDNENPTITSPGTLSLLRGYEFQFNLSASDPENRSVQFEVVDFGGNAFNFSSDGLWTWFIPHNASRNETYDVSFIAVDECNGTSEAYSPEIRLVDCPCTSNGRCVLKEGSLPGSGEFECICNFGFNGSLCEIDLNYCVSNPCINNGTCILDGNGFYCNCSDEFEGDLCEIEKPSLKWNDCSMYGCNKPSVPSSCLESRWLYNFAEQSLTVEVERPIIGNESHWIGFGLSTNTSDKALVDWSIVYFDQSDGSLHVRDEVSSIDRTSTVYLNHSKVFKAEGWIINGTMHVVITRNLSSSNLQDVENFLVEDAFFVFSSGLHNASSSDFHFSYQLSSPTIIDFQTRCLGCSNLESIVNSHPIEYSDNFLSDGVTATYSCNGTHLLLGNQSRQCVDGIWTGAEPRCLKPCEDPVVPANGFATIAFVQGSDLILGSNVTFRCEDGLKVCGKKQLTCQADGEWDYPYPDCKLFCHVQNITVDIDMPIHLQYTTAGSVLLLFPGSIVLDTGKLGDEGWKSVIVCLKGIRNSSSSDEEIVHDKQLAINSSRVSEADFSPSGHANSSSVSFQSDRVIFTFNRYGKLNISAFLFTLAYKDTSPTDYLERNLTVFVVDIYDRKSSKIHITVQHSAINDNIPVLTPNHQAINFTEGQGPITLFQKPLDVFDADHETLEFPNGFCSLTAVDDSSYLPERDILRADCPYFTTNYYTVNGTLTITGSNNSQAYEQCFNTIQYDFLGEVSPLIRRDVKCSLSDGIHIGIATIRINLFNVNDPPSLTIDGNATEISKTYVQYGDPVAVFESLVISDEDSFIQKAHVKALGLHRSAQQNERNDSIIFSTQSSNLEIIMTESDGELEWNVTGNATKEEYQAFVRGLLFQSSNEQPFRLTSDNRLFALQVFDDGLASNVIQTTIIVIPVNDAPILQFNPDADPYALPTSESLVSFATFRKGLPLLVFPNTTTLEDVDSSNLNQFTCLLRNATDGVLEIIGVNETLTTLYDLSVDIDRTESVTVSLIIGGLASVRNYKSAIMSIYYFHNNQSVLTPGNRVIECAATDDENSTSAIAQVTIGFNYCDLNPCVHGVCTSNERGFVCDCSSGYFGELCSIKRCGDPVVPANGFANIAFAQGSDLILDSNVTFYCEDGFEVCGENQLTCQADGEWNYPYPDCKLFCDAQNITVDSGMSIDLQYMAAGSVLWLFPESIVLNTGKLGDKGWKSVIVCLKGITNSSSTDEEIVHEKQLAINSSRVSEADFLRSGHGISSSVLIQFDRVVYNFSRSGELNISTLLFTLAYKDISPTDYFERNLTVFAVDIYNRESSKIHIVVQHSAINDNSPVLSPSYQAINYTEGEGSIILFQKRLEIHDADHDTLKFPTGFCSLTAVQESSYLPERDILRADCPYFTTNYDTVNGTFTITGSNNSKAYERCFNAIEYEFLGEVSPLIRRDVTCSLSDGIHVGIATIRINLFNVNDPPSLTINGNATELSKTYVQYGDPVAVFESLAISDEDSFIQKAHVKALGLHMNAQQNERNDSVVFSTESSKLGIVMVESDGEVEWNVTGNATIEEYQFFIRGLLFQSSNEKPFRLTSEDRLFTLQVFDDKLASNVIKTMVTVISVNDAPILQFNPESNPYALPTSESLVSFATFQKGSPLLVFPNTTTLEDVDSTNLRQFTCLLQNATDGVLEIIGVNETLTTLYNLSVDLNRTESDTATLIISGLASVRNYKSAVMSIYYFHNNQSLLTPGNRVIECAATDDENATSAIAQVIIGFNYCFMDPCVHGDCTSNERGFVCSCFNGYDGELCNIIQTIANTTWRSCDMEGSEAGSYSVTMTARWSYNPNKSVLTTEIKRSVGDFWIGIGLSVNGTMCNSDIVTAFFSLRDGSLQVQKRKASFYGEPMIIASDTTILDSNATTVNGEMIVIIRQNIDYVANGSIHIILATGKLVDNNVSHGEIFYHVNSRWSSPSPVNFNDCLGCSLLEKPHGFYAINYSDTIHYRGATATHPCYENGVFVGEKWRECTDSAIWTGSNLTCICPLPDASFMGNVSVRTSGTKSIFGCKKNLTACGETELTCLEGGLWDLPFPRCRLFCSVQVLHFGPPNFLQDITLQYSAPNTILWIIPNPHNFVTGDLGNNGWESVQVTLSGVVNIHSDIESITEARSAALNLGRVSEQELLSNGRPSKNVASLGDDTLVYTFSRTESLDLNIFLSTLAYVHQNPSDYLIRNVSLIVTDVYKDTSPTISVAIQHIGQNENAPIIFNKKDVSLQFSEGDNRSVNVFQYNLTISDADNVLFHKLEFAHCVIVSAPSGSFDANKEYIFANDCRALNISRKNDTGDLWIRGKAAPEDYADCLNSLYYFHGGEIFPSLYRRISCTVSDGIHEASTSVKVDLVNINDRPSLMFPHEMNTSIIQYRQYEPPVKVFEGGRILDPDSDFLTMALIQIVVSDDQNVDLSGEIILPNSNVGQVDVDLEQTQNALMINVTGNASASFYESYLDSIQFYNPETKPFNLSSVSRVFTVKVFDGEMWSNSLTSTVDVIPINDAPVLRFFPEHFSGSNQVVFAEDSHPKFIAPNTTTLIDVDSTKMSRLQCHMDGALDGSFEGLRIDSDLAQEDNVSYEISQRNAETFVVLANGLAETDYYLNIISSVQYFNNKEEVTAGDRRFRCNVTDSGGETSETAMIIIVVRNVNDGIDINLDASSLSITFREGQLRGAYVIPDPHRLSASDNENHRLRKASFELITVPSGYVDEGEFIFIVQNVPANLKMTFENTEVSKKLIFEGNASIAVLTQLARQVLYFSQEDEPTLFLPNSNYPIKRYIVIRFYDTGTPSATTELRVKINLRSTNDHAPEIVVKPEGNQCVTTKLRTRRSAEKYSEYKMISKQLEVADVHTGNGRLGQHGSYICIRFSDETNLPPVARENDLAQILHFIPSIVNELPHFGLWQSNDTLTIVFPGARKNSMVPLFEAGFSFYAQQRNGLCAPEIDCVANVCSSGGNSCPVTGEYTVEPITKLKEEEGSAPDRV